MRVPWEMVNQMRERAERAVPTRVLAPEVQVGSLPGLPLALRGLARAG